ncbi:MAG: hypothetical protein FJ207_08765 [Gemmatimonadetes bacterium]|nr:hypothetical protein [Gemmatimonadota bacterium]
MKLLGGRERVRLTDDDLRLRRIVHELGHATAEAPWSLSGFWGEVAKKWKTETRKKLTARTLSDRYRRFLKREPNASGVKVTTHSPQPVEDPDGEA